ncbi:branched-chain amino acid ABC transporter substrate-binding protein [Georgenia sp. TF02-10]|uniref:branched-chain amino acid ABC transporter substrate-binding protein n=1 Tax=Georgenia sp. TF02-10 TaxID=2917725 RepID=UPI001FA7E023|nr:branched-chain amino acid ABC transporter substrate-binding protein [Georgenia sp. TF02-10]UNX55114.1 branched-chain amino acid ABC transporter substrate-binding protein [Georgenia sp. TF02-10]
MRNPFSRRGHAAVALGAVAALALGACSGGVAGGEDAATEDEGPIRLGMLAPFSGSEAAFGPYMENGAQMAIDEINEDGGVLDRDLELVTEDDACDATSATAAANKLITAGIVASVGGYCSGATLPTLPIFADAGVPMVIPAANSNQLVEADENGVFLINGTGDQQAQAALEWAQKQGAQRLALVDDNTDYSADLAAAVAEQAAETDIEIVLEESVTAGESDYSANVNSILSADPDMVYWTGYYQEGGLIAAQLAAAGYAGELLVADGTVDAKFAEIAGAAAQGVEGTFTQTPDMLEGAEDWIAQYEERYGEGPGPYSTQAYDAVRVVAEGIEAAGGTESEALIEAIQNIDGLELFSGPLKFTEEGTLSAGGFAIVEVGPEGDFVLLDDLQG